MIKHSPTLTLTDKQKHNQNNNKQKHIQGDVNPKKPPDMSLIRNMGTGTGTVPPKNINQCYCRNLEITIPKLYDYQNKSKYI